MSSVPGVLLKIGWISHWDDDDLVKVTLRFLWSTTICRDSIFNVLGTKSCPLGRFWWLERLNTCQSSLLVKAWVFPKKPATSTCSWPSWSISLYPIVNAMSFPYILFGCISFNQPNMVQLDQSCGEKTWRTRSSGWGYKMKVSVQTHWSPFPPSNKTAYRMLPVGFFNVFFFFRGSFSASWFSWSVFILAKRCMYITILEYIHKLCFNVHLSIIFLRWSNSMQVFKHSVGWLHLCLFLLCNYHILYLPHPPTFIGDLVSASLINRWILLQIQPGRGYNSDKKWHCSTIHKTKSLQLVYFGHFKSSVTGWRLVDADTYFLKFVQAWKKSFLYKDKMMQFA